MRKLSVKVIATISNQWITSQFEWYFRNHFIAEQEIESYKRIYGNRFKVLSISDID